MMRVGQRLFLAVLPAVLGVFTVAGLAYWGRYARQAPEWLIVVAVVAAFGSLLVAWRNTRYVARRIEDLAAWRSGESMSSGPLHRAAMVLGHTFGLRANSADEPDELDTIEGVVDRLTNALTEAKTAQAAKADSLARLRREYGELVASGAKDAIGQLEQVRLPLHILLENHFGELNENQEEMLGAARVAAEAADKALLRLREIADLDLGNVALREERIRISDVMAALLPALRLEAESREIRVEADLTPALPAISVDRGKLQETLMSILRDSLRRTPRGRALRVNADADAGDIRVVVTGATEALRPEELALATRVVRAHGGTLDATQDTITLRLPIQRL